MKYLKIKITQLFLLLPAIMFFSCDIDGEESVDWRPGETLMIAGPATANTLSTATYFVRGFTVDKTYTWTLAGPSGEVTTRRNAEYADVVASAPGEYTLTVSNGMHSGSLTITVSSVKQAIGFASDTLMVSEVAADTVFVPVVIDSRNVSETVVNFAIVGGTAVEGVDYKVVTTSPLTFEAGETSQDIAIVIISDNIREANESIVVGLTGIVSTGAGEAAATLAPDQRFVVIIEDDLKFISFEEILMDTLTGPANAGNYVFNVLLSQEANEDVTVPYTITGVGVNPLVGSVTFPAGTTPGEFAVKQPVYVNISEAAFLADQTITITLGDPVSADEEVDFALDSGGERIGDTMEIFIRLAE